MGKMSQLHADTAEQRAGAAESEVLWLRDEVARLEDKIFNALAAQTEGDPSGELRKIAAHLDEIRWPATSDTVRAVARSIDVVAKLLSD